MSGDLDVTMRLRLVQDIDKEAKRGLDGLKGLDRALDTLGKGKNLDVDRNLQKLAQEARRSQTAVKGLDTEVRRLGNIKTDVTEREINALGAAAAANKARMGELEQTINRVRNIKTDPLEAEIRQIGKAARDSKVDLDRLKVDNAVTPGLRNEKPLDHSVPRRPSASLNVPSAIGVAWLASQVDETARWVNNIGDAARNVERSLASVAVTAEMRNPETIAKLGLSNNKLAMRYGIDRSRVNDTRLTFAASGVGIDSQERILDPTLKTAKASDSDPNNVAQSVIAAKQNLHLVDSEVAAFFDQLTKGTKLGSFEVDAVAKNLPKLASAYEQTGRKGLDATSELIAFAQIARKTAGSSDDAAVNMQNLLGKIFSKDTRDSFKDNGINLDDVYKQSQKNGTSYLMDVLDQMIKVAGDDPMKVNDFFGDQQARNAAVAMANNRKLYDDWQNQIRNESAGTVDKDWNYLKELPAEKKARSDQAYQQQYEDVTGKLGGAIAPFIDNIARLINRQFNEQRFLEDVPMLDKQSVSRRAELEAELKRLTDTGESGATILGPRKAQIRAELQALEEEDAIRKSEQKRLSREHSIGNAEVPRASDDLGKTTGKIPVPADRPVETKLGKDMSGSAEVSMDTYNKALRAGLEQAVSFASDAAAKMKSLLSFTATPTISPNMVNPGSNNTTTKSVPGKQSSLSSTTNTKVTQHISTPSAVRAARLAQREQDRAVRMARNRAYSDMGSMPA